VFYLIKDNLVNLLSAQIRLVHPSNDRLFPIGGLRVAFARLRRRPRTHLPGGGGLLAALTRLAAIHVRLFPSGGGLSAV